MGVREYDGELEPVAKEFHGEIEGDPPKPEPQKTPDPIEVTVEAPAIEDAVQSIDRYAGKADALAQSNYLLLASIKRLVEKTSSAKPDTAPRKWRFNIERDDHFRMTAITAESD